MDRTTRLWVLITGMVVLVLLLLAGRALIFWKELPLDKKETLFNILHFQPGYLLLTISLVLLGLFSLSCLLMRLYVHPLKRLSEETNLIHTANSSHRITPLGGKTMCELTETINTLATRYANLEQGVAREISLSKADLEKEKNILAAFVGELQEGVLICTAEGRIIFYNRRAKVLFSETPKKEVAPTGSSPSTIGAREKHVGLGRSVFNLIDKNLIVHALDDVEKKLNSNDVSMASYFVVAIQQGRLLRIETIPVLNTQRQLTGFVFSASDITDKLQKDSRLDSFIQSLTKGIRASVTSILTSVETVMAYPEMDSEHRQQFNSIIQKESIALGKLTEEMVANFPHHTKSRWPLVPMPARNLVETVAIKAQDTLNINVSTSDSDRAPWVRVESYSTMLVILFVLNKLKTSRDISSFACRAVRRDKFVNIDICWQGQSVMLQELRNWTRERLMIKHEGLALTLQEVLDHHHASIWSSTTKSEAHSSLCILLPECEPEATTVEKHITILTEDSRPVFFDYDLFHQQGLTPDLNNRRLTDLRYTVFDTETTGLLPHEGDEIISIGAVRVINCQMLQEELFDQLIDPQRPVPPQSIKIHGITGDMLQGQPTIDRVLPSFQAFCEESILVAHNAAFDMLMLQKKVDTTGVELINPVLDTLLLWDILHPNQERHNFSTIAELLGVRVVGRHTALGDALATAEMFIKMIPLLEARGIRTLKEALEASQKSHFTHLKY